MKNGIAILSIVLFVGVAISSCTKEKHELTLASQLALHSVLVNPITDSATLTEAQALSELTGPESDLFSMDDKYSVQCCCPCTGLVEIPTTYDSAAVPPAPIPGGPTTNLPVGKALRDSTHCPCPSNSKELRVASKRGTVTSVKVDDQSFVESSEEIKDAVVFSLAEGAKLEDGPHKLYITGNLTGTEKTYEVPVIVKGGKPYFTNP